MRFVDSAPTRWPAPERLASWWREQVGDALDELLERPAAAGLLRTAGTGAAPGSRWEVTHPSQRGAGAEVLVTGVPSDRGLRAVGRLAGDPDLEAVLEVDGLDVPRRATSHSRLRHLGWDVAVTADPRRLLEARVELDWVLVTASAAVRPRGAVDHLEVRLVVRGRGAWRPVLAPLLRASAGPVRSELARVVRVLAAAIEAVAVAGADGDSSVRRRVPLLLPGRHAAPRSSQVRGPGDRAGPGVRRVDLVWLASPVRALRWLGAGSARTRGPSLLRVLRRWTRGAPRLR